MSFQANLLAENKACPDESKAPWREAFRSELYAPKDETNKAALPYAIRIDGVFGALIWWRFGVSLLHKTRQK